MTENTDLVRRALKLVQTNSHPLYLFTLTAAEVLQIADVSRVSRDEAGTLIGYQRPEVQSHVQDIVDYLDSDPVIFPNAIIMALSSTVKFVAGRGPKTTDGLATIGTLTLPLPTGGQPRPAWIVDGQQRAVALSRARRTDLPVPITAFVADAVSLQRDQFLRVNNTKPLPRSLVTELLPEVDSPLPTHLTVRKAPSFLCDRLNNDPDSPFYRMIKRASTSKKDAARAVIADNSVVQMLQESYTSPAGCLYPYRNLSTGDTDIDGIHHALCVYWSAIRDAFPDAWGKSAIDSRLMHGAGIRAMGRLMDRVLGTIDVHQPEATAEIRKHLDLVAPHCRWTSGTWEESGLRWDAVENVHGHIQKLSNYLIRVYLTARANIR
ncbi:DGQHR domain-containing protein [Dactylosporangium roseum]|uniref:DGQHR domain-containing protein n=1 Tax=Dactylosporangium roseum TaxID=47989 RepID=A0ABY5Z425_9ACTN|nr:DGQHR domain-containing protein DpdB [Dactylosporangium roseum]UWZ36394.1 DGQHR domain-containing protein [Dactylosporangium roseum]